MSVEEQVEDARRLLREYDGVTVLTLADRDELTRRLRSIDLGVLPPQMAEDLRSLSRMVEEKALEERMWEVRAYLEPRCRQRFPAGIILDCLD